MDDGNMTKSDKRTPESRFIDPVIEFYMRGVDCSLLRENLRLTIAQRIEKYQSFLLPA